METIALGFASLICIQNRLNHYRAMKSRCLKFNYVLLFFFPLFSREMYSQRDSIAGIYRGAPKSAPANLKKHLLNLYSNKECVYDSHLPGEYHKRGRWFLTGDTVTCLFDVAVIHKNNPRSKVLGVAEKNLGQPQIQKYLITKKNNLTKIPSGVHFIKDPPKPAYFSPPLQLQDWSLLDAYHSTKPDSIIGRYVSVDAKKKDTDVARIPYDQKKYNLDLWNNRYCEYWENSKAFNYKSGHWNLSGDTVICTFNQTKVNSIKAGTKITITKENKLVTPFIQKYFVTKKCCLSPLNSKLSGNFNFLKDPGRHFHYWPPSHVGVLDATYTPDHILKKQKQLEDSLAQVRISIYQAKTIQDSIAKLFIGTWKSDNWLPCLGCNETKKEKEKRIKKLERKFGYMIYTFSEDGTFKQQYIHPKRKGEIWYLIGDWNITSKFVPKDRAWSQILRKYNCCWENQINFTHVEPYQGWEPENPENRKNYETGTAHLYLKDHRFEIQSIELPWSFFINDTLSSHGSHFVKN